MKKFKQIFTAIISMVLVIAMAGTSCTFADSSFSENKHAESVETIQIGEETITITGYETKDKQSVRVYKRDDTAAGLTEKEDIIELLLALGIRPDMIETIPDTSFERFAIAKEIRVAVGYEKINEESGESSFVEKTVAESEAARLQEQVLEDFIKQNTGQNHSNSSNKNPDIINTRASGTNGDSYRTITFTTTYLGNGAYHYFTNVKWLNMPAVRWYDSLGACAMNNTVTPSSRTGIYQYKYTTVNYATGNVTNSTSGIYTLANAYKKNQVNGNWYGSAGVFSLPQDYETDDYGVTYYDYQATYAYDGHYTDYTNPGYFNAIGTHSHSTSYLVSSNPAITISFGVAGFSASLTLNTVYKQDYSVEDEINYLP